MITQRQRHRKPKGLLEYWQCPCGKKVFEKAITYVEIEGIIRIKHKCGQLCYPVTYFLTNKTRCRNVDGRMQRIPQKILSTNPKQY